MNNLIKHINKLNNLYHSFKKNYSDMKKMFRNHSCILQKIKLSEEILMQAYMLISEKTEETEQHREFNKIIKGIKNENKNL
jgi:hypothetical protein